VTRGQIYSSFKVTVSYHMLITFRILCTHYSLHTRSELAKSISVIVKQVCGTFTIFQVYIIYDIILIINTMYAWPSLVQALQSRSHFILT
jgi:hypothetical protein